MNGAIALLPDITRMIPNRTRKIIIGASHHFFLSRRKRMTSFNISILDPLPIGLPVALAVVPYKNLLGFIVKRLLKKKNRHFGSDGSHYTRKTREIQQLRRKTLLKHNRAQGFAINPGISFRGLKQPFKPLFRDYRRRPSNPV